MTPTFSPPQLEEAATGAPAAVDALVSNLYSELKRLARNLLRREQQARTLDTTALVHEAYFKLIGSQQVSERGRAYFFGAAARAMRQVLVDSARRRQRLKRGGRVSPIPLSGIDPPAEELFTTDILAVDDAMKRLAEHFPRQARVVECRFFGGLSVDETAAALETSPRTVKRDWNLARAWLFRDLQGSDRTP